VSGEIFIGLPNVVPTLKPRKVLKKMSEDSMRRGCFQRNRLRGVRAITAGIMLLIIGLAIPQGQADAAQAIFKIADMSTVGQANSDTSAGADHLLEQRLMGAQRVVLYDEDPSNPQGKRYDGQVLWRTDQVGGSNGQPNDIAVRADIDIPDKFKMTFLIRRNNDSSPASHTAELTFVLPPGFAEGGIDNVPGILMKSYETARGTALAGRSVKVTDGFFLLGLLNVEADRNRNIQLLKERPWFDILLVYTNKRRAIIALDNGVPGDRAFNEAFAAWGQ
jgi:hypothetical protein